MDEAEYDLMDHLRRDLAAAWDRVRWSHDL